MLVVLFLMLMWCVGCSILTGVSKSQIYGLKEKIEEMKMVNAAMVEEKTSCVMQIVQLAQSQNEVQQTLAAKTAECNTLAEKASVGEELTRSLDKIKSGNRSLEMSLDSMTKLSDRERVRADKNAAELKSIAKKCVKCEAAYTTALEEKQKDVDAAMISMSNVERELDVVKKELEKERANQKTVEELNNLNVELQKKLDLIVGELQDEKKSLRLAQEQVIGLTQALQDTFNNE